MNEAKKDKVERTLKRLKESRSKPENKLKSKIEDKLKWAEAEKQKGLLLIKTHQLEIQKHLGTISSLEGQIRALDGAIALCKDLLETRETK